MSDFELPGLVWSGSRNSDIELTRDGFGEYPNSYGLTLAGLATVAVWMEKNKAVDIDDCTLCAAMAHAGTNGFCLYHQGFIDGASYASERVKNTLEEL